MKYLYFLILAAIFYLIPFNHAQIQAEPLRATLSYDEIAKSFFGTWHVTSKIESATDYSMFNKLSVDIWNLSGFADVLILENALTGATSNIKIENAAQIPEGKKLKFTRVKEFQDGNFKYRHTESPEFTLNGAIFRGYDTFTVEKFNLDGKPISVNVVKYKIVGQKIAGE